MRKTVLIETGAIIARNTSAAVPRDKRYYLVAPITAGLRAGPE